MRSAEEIEVLKQYKTAPPNVREAFAIYDSIVLSENWYGGESNVQGWYNTFRAFGQQSSHSFFKSRTWAEAGLPYTNRNNADSMDYAFIVDSIGLAVMGPPSTIEGADNAGALLFPDLITSHWFQTDFLNHIAFELKIQQDTRLETVAVHLPPGYGSVGSGAAFEFTNEVTPGSVYGQIPYQYNSVTNGVPILANRYPFPDPIGIPRTATIEGIVHVGELARNDLQLMDGPRQYWQNSDDGLAPYTFFDRRYVIQVSLIGTRLVQQRAQYHR